MSDEALPRLLPTYLRHRQLAFVGLDGRTQRTSTITASIPAKSDTPTPLVEGGIW